MHRVCCVCEQDNYEHWFKPSQSPGPIVSCRGCGFVYVNPIETTKSLIQEGPVLDGRPSHLLESTNLEEIEGSWEQPIIERYMTELAAKQKNALEVLTRINRITNEKGDLLDVGCFCGVFLSVAKEQGWNCFGLEPLVMPAIYARGRFGLQIVTGTLRDNSFPSSQFFDVVTAFQVFEHLVDPADEIRKIKKILKPKGLLVIEVPNIDTILVKFLKTKHRHFVEDHVSFFSATTLSRLFERMGFEVKDIYYPKRELSVRHLIWWSQKYLGSTLGNYLNQSLSAVHLDDKTIGLNLGDIVTVMAEKKD